MTAFGAATAYAQDQMDCDKKPADKMADDNMPEGKSRKSKNPKKERMKDGDKMSKDGISSHQ